MELTLLALLVIVGLAVAAVVGFVFFLIKMVFWVVFLPVRLVFWTLFLPFRLLFKLLWLPVGLAFGGVGMTLGLAAMPILLIGGGIFLALAAVVMIVGLLIPAIPFVLFGLLIWALLRKNPPVPPIPA